MSKIDSLQTMLVEQLRDIYDAEQRLTKAIPKMVKAATDESLTEALEHHLAETQEQVSRLEEVFQELGETARAKACAGMRGIIEEGDEHIREDFAEDGLRDAMIIGSAQRVEHYEIAAYGTAIAHARLLGLDGVVEKLEQTLNEEKAADAKLTDIAEGVVNLEAAESDDEAGAAGTGEAGRRSTGRSGSAGNGRSGGNGRMAKMGGSASSRSGRSSSGDSRTASRSRR